MNKLISGLAIATLGLTLTASAAFANEIGKGQGEGQSLDINAYCVHTNQGPDSSVILGTQDWGCTNNGTGKAINLHDVCKYEYSGYDDVKELRSGDPLSYVCLK